jgi:hypothetical protein
MRKLLLAFLHDLDNGRPMLGERDKKGAPVGGMRLPGDEAALDEPVDMVGNSACAHLKGVGLGDGIGPRISADGPDPEPAQVHLPSGAMVGALGVTRQAVVAQHHTGAAVLFLERNDDLRGHRSSPR